MLDEDVVLERLWAKVHRRRADQCWPWTGNEAGLISVGYGNSPVLARVYVYEDAHGALPKNTRVRNTCKTRHCMNPAHMETVRHRRLSLAELRLVLRLLDAEVAQVEIARRLKCSQASISYIDTKRRKRKKTHGPNASR